jgi:phospholipid/cholesterol/gamma-HCH transport system substrate-binding protein
METRAHALSAALFMIVLLFLTALSVLWFSLGHSRRIPYDLIAPPSVTGLRIRAPVRYRGFGVGTVQSVQFDPNRPGQIVIRILIDRATPITHSTFGSLQFQGITGVAFIQLEDTGHEPTRLTSSAKHVAQIPMWPGFLDQLQKRVDKSLRVLESIEEQVDSMLSEDSRNQLMLMALSLQHAADGLSAFTLQIAPKTSRLPTTVNELGHTILSANDLISHLNVPNGPLMTNLNKGGRETAQAGETLSFTDMWLQDLSARMDNDTLPYANRFAVEADNTARSVKHAADQFSFNLRGPLFDMPRATPDPGKSDFKRPKMR